LAASPSVNHLNSTLPWSPKLSRMSFAVFNVGLFTEVLYHRVRSCQDPITTWLPMGYWAYSHAGSTRPMPVSRSPA
jgi:hypothetical protein